MNTNTRKPGRNRGGRSAAVAVAVESLEGRSLFSATHPFALVGGKGALMSLGGSNAPVVEHHTGALRNVTNSNTPESTGGALLNVSGSDTWTGLTADVPDADAAASKSTPKLFLHCATGQH